MRWKEEKIIEGKGLNYVGEREAELKRKVMYFVSFSLEEIGKLWCRGRSRAWEKVRFEKYANGSKKSSWDCSVGFSSVGEDDLLAGE